MSPTLSGDALEIRNGIIFDFYPGPPHIHVHVYCIMYMHVNVVTALRQQMYTLKHLFLMFFNFKLAFQDMGHNVTYWY